MQMRMIQRRCCNSNSSFDCCFIPHVVTYGFILFRAPVHSLPHSCSSPLHMCCSSPLHMCCSSPLHMCCSSPLHMCLVYSGESNQQKGSVLAVAQLLQHMKENLGDAEMQVREGRLLLNYVLTVPKESWPDMARVPKVLVRGRRPIRWAKLSLRGQRPHAEAWRSKACIFIFKICRSALSLAEWRPMVHTYTHHEPVVCHAQPKDVPTYMHTYTYTHTYTYIHTYIHHEPVSAMLSRRTPPFIYLHTHTY
jgi:hypothetical protein